MQSRFSKLSSGVLALALATCSVLAPGAIESVDPLFSAETLQTLLEGRFALSVAFPESAHLAYSAEPVCEFHDHLGCADGRHPRRNGRERRSLGMRSRILEHMEESASPGQSGLMHDQRGLS